jgi:hypothetical protein
MSRPTTTELGGWGRDGGGYQGEEVKRAEGGGGGEGGKTHVLCFEVPPL